MCGSEHWGQEAGQPKPAGTGFTRGSGGFGRNGWILGLLDGCRIRDGAAEMDVGKCVHFLQKQLPHMGQLKTA